MSRRSSKNYYENEYQGMGFMTKNLNELTNVLSVSGN